MIYILTGEIRTGKTSALLDWINTSTALSGINRNNVDGLLCPDDNKGLRNFLKVKSKAIFPFEIESESNVDSEKIVSIGPFRFLKESFQKANDYLLSVASEMDSKYVIIDELGKLELKNQGLHHAAETLIPDFLFSTSQHLILVVRASLLEDIIEHYNISEYQLLKIEDLKSFN
jgi:nucleoside-triphosphatase THEP1